MVIVVIAHAAGANFASEALQSFIQPFPTIPLLRVGNREIRRSPRGAVPCRIRRLDFQPVFALGQRCERNFASYRDSRAVRLRVVARVNRGKSCTI